MNADALRFLPTTRTEAQEHGWDELDIIIVTGDAYVDSPFFGVAVIARVLEAAGYRVGIIAQPDVESPDDIARLGEPRLFWGVTAGVLDSLVANYTASRKRRRQDDLTAGSLNNRRPDRACIVYANLIRRVFKGTVPIVLGGLEASLRRFSHYDAWSGTVRRSVLVDAKADVLVYGMGEHSVVELARRLNEGTSFATVPGICLLERHPRPGYRILPSHDEVSRDASAYLEAFRMMHGSAEPGMTVGLCQKQDTRWLIQNPPPPRMTPEQLDAIYELPYCHDAHPSEARRGSVRALETVRFSVTTHRGCFGDCSFCAITAHQGRTVVSRTENSIVREVERMTRRPGFTGYITDIGGPTANMYGMACTVADIPCSTRRCTYPRPCPNLRVDHGRLLRLLQRIRAVPGVRKAFVASGIRHDLVIADRQNGQRYLDELVSHHISGQLKIAPEHTVEHVLRLMGKPGPDILLEFKRRFDHATQCAGLRQFLTYYFIAAHPGCDERAMRSLAAFVRRHLRIVPEQVQIFTPLPGTCSAAMYATGVDPWSGRSIFVERNLGAAARQKALLIHGPMHSPHPERRPGYLTIRRPESDFHPRQKKAGINWGNRRRKNR